MRTHLTNEGGDRPVCGTARAKLTTAVRAEVDCKRCTRTRAFRQPPDAQDQPAVEKRYRLRKLAKRQFGVVERPVRPPDAPDAVDRVSYWQARCSIAERETAKLRVELANHLKSEHTRVARTLNGRIPSILGW